jgi:hypothetical protein
MRPAFGFAAALLVAVGMLSFFASCDVSSPPSTNAPPLEQTNAAEPASSQQLKQRQVAFLNRIRAADPQQQTIDRALLNEQNELGLVLDRSVEMEKVPDLMRALLSQMAQQFPGQDLTIVAYAPTNPPLKMGAAHLNARTRDMTYTPENK